MHVSQKRMRRSLRRGRRRLDGPRRGEHDRDVCHFDRVDLGSLESALRVTRAGSGWQGLRGFDERSESFFPCSLGQIDVGEFEGLQGGGVLDGEFAEVGGFGGGVFEADGGDPWEEELRCVVSGLAAKMARVVGLWCRGRSCLVEWKRPFSTEPRKAEADEICLER